MRACILRTIQETDVNMRRTERRNPISVPPRKAEKPKPARQNFVYLSKKMDKLEKAL
jgi:hypothetical protein